MLHALGAIGDGLPPADERRQRVSPRPLEARVLRRRRRSRRGRRQRRRGRRLLVPLLLLEGDAVAPAGVALVEDDLKAVSWLNF